MNLPQNDYQILRLTEHFYNAYPDPPYREVLKKNQRAYNCLLFQTHYDFLYAFHIEQKYITHMLFISQKPKDLKHINRDWTIVK